MAKHIFEGNKMYEIRPAIARYDLEPNTLVRWHWYTQERLETMITQKIRYNSIEDCLRALGVEMCLPGMTMAEAVEPRQKNSKLFE